MSMTTLLGTLNFNTRGAQWFGMPSTTIALSFEDHPAFGLTWQMRWLTRGGVWLNFANTAQCYSAADRAAFLAAVNAATNNNTPNMDAFVGQIGGWVQPAIQAEFGEYIGAGIAPPPNLPSGTPITAANLVDAMGRTLGNDFKFVPTTGAPVFQHK